MSRLFRQLDAGYWTAPQRRLLIVLLALLAGFVAIRLLRRRQFVPDPLPAKGLRAAELQWRIDLNTADASEISAIPRLGESKAKAIVDYRTQFESVHPGRPAFVQLDDLFHIKGIGAGTILNLKPFVTIQSTSQAATKTSP